jgi:hypothetical protein
MGKPHLQVPTSPLTGTTYVPVQYNEDRAASVECHQKQGDHSHSAAHSVAPMCFLLALMPHNQG